MHVQSVINQRCYAVLVISETWHERADSVALKRTVPYGYHYIEAARPIPLDTDVNTVNIKPRRGLLASVADRDEWAVLVE